MTVVAVWDARGRETARARVRELFPSLKTTIETQESVIGVDRGEVSGFEVQVGNPPIHSRITATQSGIILARGPAWSAPIYFRRENGLITAASHLAPLVRPGEAVDLPYLASLVGCLVRANDDRTVFSSIRQLRPFETILATHGDVRSTISKSTPKLEELRNVSLDDLAEELRALVFASVARVCKGRRVAVMVGGLDSSTVLSAAMQGGAADVFGMTIDFVGPSDDRPHVRTLEKHFGIPVTRISPEEFRPATRKSLVHDKAPSRHPGDGFGVTFGRRALELGADVIITGGGGDEIFGTDLGPAFAFRLRRGDFRAVRRALDTVVPHYPPAWRRLRDVGVAFMRPHLPQWVRAARAERSWRAAPKWHGPLLANELRVVLDEASSRPIPPETPETRYNALARSPHESFFAEVRAQTDAAGGAPRIDPIFTDDLVQFIARIPPDILFADNLDRGLLRRAMRGWLPESVRTRIDKARFGPAFRGAIWPVDDLKHLLGFDNLERAGIVRARELRANLSNFYSAPGALHNGIVWNHFWPSLTGEAFLSGREA